MEKILTTGSKESTFDDRQASQGRNKGRLTTKEYIVGGNVERRGIIGGIEMNLFKDGKTDKRCVGACRHGASYISKNEAKENLEINPFDFIFDLVNTRGRDFRRLEIVLFEYRNNLIEIFIFIGKLTIKKIYLYKYRE